MSLSTLFDTFDDCSSTARREISKRMASLLRVCPFAHSIAEFGLNEDEDDVTRKRRLEDVEVAISPIGRSWGL